MSGLFGWSLSDVVLLTQTVLKIKAALLPKTTILEIERVLKTAEPSFRNAVQAQLGHPANSIASFNRKLQTKYKEALGIGSSRKLHSGMFRKVGWAYSAAEDLSDLWIQLSRQLEIVKLLMMSNVQATLFLNNDTLSVIESQSRDTQSVLGQSIVTVKAQVSESAKTIQDLAVNSSSFADETKIQLQRLERESHLTSQKLASLEDNTQVLVQCIRIRSLEDEYCRKGDIEREKSIHEALSTLHAAIMDLKEQEEGTASRTCAGLSQQLSLIQQQINGLERILQGSHQECRGASTSAQSVPMGGDRPITRTIISMIDKYGAAVEIKLGMLSASIQANFYRLIQFLHQARWRLVAARYFAILPFRAITGNVAWIQDFLGETHVLDLRYFQEFENFKVYFRNKLKGGPGAGIAKARLYRIAKLSDPTCAITASNWSRSMENGGDLAISACVDSLCAFWLCSYCLQPLPELHADPGSCWHSEISYSTFQSNNPKKIYSIHQRGNWAFQKRMIVRSRCRRPRGWARLHETEIHVGPRCESCYRENPLEEQMHDDMFYIRNMERHLLDIERKGRSTAFSLEE